MRDSYHHHLDRLADGLVEMSRLAAAAVTDATVAVVDSDVFAAEHVIAGDLTLNELYRQLDEQALLLLARQQPVASDLRAIVTALRMSSDLERAGDYAVHIAKVARRRHPLAVLPEAIRPLVQEIGDKAAHMTAEAGDVVHSRDLDLAAQLRADDDAVDALHRTLLHVLLEPSRPLPVNVVVDITLVARYYERLADHAVAVADAVTYLVTGEHVAQPA